MAETPLVKNQFTDYPGGASQYGVLDVSPDFLRVQIESEGFSLDDSDVTVEFLPQFAPDKTEGSSYWRTADVPTGAGNLVVLEDARVRRVRVKKDATGDYEICVSQ